MLTCARSYDLATGALGHASEGQRASPALSLMSCPHRCLSHIVCPHGIATMAVATTQESAHLRAMRVQVEAKCGADCQPIRLVKWTQTSNPSRWERKKRGHERWGAPPGLRRGGMTIADK